jgi:hypothetical protein
MLEGQWLLSFVPSSTKQRSRHGGAVSCTTLLPNSWSFLLCGKGCAGQGMCRVWPVGFEKSVTSGEQPLQAARSYSLIRPPSTGRRVMRLGVRSVGVGVGRGRGGVVDRCSGERIP